MSRLEKDMKNLRKSIDNGLNIHYGPKNGNWRGGGRVKGVHPCSKCGKSRFIEKRNAYRPCISCALKKRCRGKVVDTSGYASGPRHYRWRGGVTPKNQKLRSSYEYREWRKAVFTRDNYTCIECGARNGEGAAVILNADHIKPFALYPDLRFDVSNGRTLCVPCHELTDTYKNKTPLASLSYS